MTYWLSIVKFVPDPAKGEFINVGAIAGSDDSQESSKRCGRELDPKAAALAALQRGLDMGLTHIDTAEMYGNGRVEELVAEAIAGRRDQVFLASKVLPQNASRQGTVRACDGIRAALAGDLDEGLADQRGV